MTLRVRVYGVLALLALLGGAVYLYKAKPAWLPGVAHAKAAPDTNKDKKDKDATPVELATANRGAISSFVSSTANIRALRDVAVSTQTEGLVDKLFAEEGDFVKEGQVLCSLDDTQLKIKLQLAEEKLAQARLQMEKARIRTEKAGAQMGHTQVELERYQKALKEGLVSDKEVAAYRYKFEELAHDQKVAAYETNELKHRMSELEAEIAQSQLDISRTQIRALFAGFITLRSVNIGQRVRALDPMFNIGAFSPLYADVHISERDARTVRPNQAAAVHLGSDDASTISGRVERLSPIVDQSSGTVKVTVAFDPKPGFRPGAFVRVDIKTDTKADAVLIPKRAIIEEDGQSYVYIAHQDTAKRNKVDLGYQSEGTVEIRRGVDVGQKIVVAGQGALKEGAKIKVLSAS
jgi:membrane fusion protein, multidrug efflux system